MQYEFKITRVDQIDLNKIIADNPGQEAILVKPARGEALLMLSEEFLSRFTYYDKQAVAEEHLDESWGYGAWGAKLDEGDEITFGDFSSARQYLNGYRARRVDLDQVDLVKEELAAARAYRPIRIQVEVL